ncbi:hypothetical protein QJS04_geneDACA024988 [Acorus gramineus]|uniref:Uncharacterized protein n=1 Tax=Acorus gramineus TaxID=55184 RepID=A0AAV9A236_ACOGR|nr:hypothetical protein QJS04_geneDACA024988 [Acorus gramineus]
MSHGYTLSVILPELVSLVCDPKARVANLWCSERGTWDIRLHQNLQDNKIEHLGSCSERAEASQLYDQSNQVQWVPNACGGHVVKLGYDWWRRHLQPNKTMSVKAKEVWESKIPSK